jgi:hypothetical protein
MRSFRRSSLLAFFLTLSISSPLAVAVTLVPIISGLSNPVFASMLAMAHSRAWRKWPVRVV